MKPRPSVAPFAVVTAACVASLCVGALGVTGLRGQAAPARAELGAAGWVPADSAWFASSLRLGEQWQLMTSSAAWRALAELPVTQTLPEVVRAQLQPTLDAVRRRLPEVDELVELLVEGVSREAFVCLDGRWPACLDRLGSAYLNAMLGAIRDRTGTDAAGIGGALDALAQIEVPGALLGLRVADAAHASALLDRLFAAAGAAVGAAPVSVGVEEIGGGRFHVVSANLAALSGRARPAFPGIDRETSARYEAWWNRLAPTVAVGLRGDYLLIALGVDTRQLRQLGAGPLLVDSAGFAPVLDALKPGVVSVQYTCPQLSARRPVVPELAGFVTDALASAGAAVPEGLAERVGADLTGLLREVAASYGEARAETVITFLNRGYETRSTRAAMPGLYDSSAPLSIQAHAGEDALLLYASRAPSVVPAYGRLVHWLQVGYSWFEDFLAPSLRGRDLEEFERFRDTFLPFAARVDAITRDDLLPAVDNCQSMLVLDAAGMLPFVPGLARQNVRFRYPRPAIVHELNDGRRFVAACTAYREAAGRLLRSAGAPADFGLPAAQRHHLAGGDLWVVPTPWSHPFKVSPSAAVTGDRLVLAMDPDRARGLLAARPWGGADVVDLAAPAGAVLRVDVRALSKLLLDDVEACLEARPGRGAARSRQAVEAWLPGLRRAVEAVRSYASRTWVDGDLELTHSWLHIEDIDR